MSTELNSSVPTSLTTRRLRSGRENFAPMPVEDSSKPTNSRRKKKTGNSGGITKPKKANNFKMAFTNRKHARQFPNTQNELSRDEISGMSEEKKLLLASWSLPNSIVQKYKQKGITSLFPWQLECLDNAKVLGGANLLYSAPTSAGKTLVAEILMVKRALELRKKAIMILPFVSVCREKMFSLQDIFGDARIRVEGFMGGHSPPGGFKAVDIAICTIEKANSLINRLLEEDCLYQLGTIVVDELHLIGDPHRGYLLELLLTKIKYMTRNSRQLEEDSMSMNSNLEEPSKKLNIQIIGMSATLPNLELLSSWLDAELVITDYRPVPLVERISYGGLIFDQFLKPVREVKLESLQVSIRGDENNLVYLSLETVLAGHSILIFCHTKEKCEVVAEQIAKGFFDVGSQLINVHSDISAKLRQQLSTQKIQEVLNQLEQSPVGLEDILKKTISVGVAYHHAGISYDERDIIESSFKRGVLKVIVATSTLSAGVNLPARRVIVSSPLQFHNKILDVLTYRQMCGRAGRQGIDTHGESILLCTNTTKDRGIELVQSNLPCVKSALLGDNKDFTLTSSMKRALLEVIASGIATHPSEVDEYAKCSLLSKCINSGLYINKDNTNVQQNQNQEDTIQECLKFLVEKDFIRLQKYESQNEVDQYMATQLGSACLASSLAPDEGITVYKELQKARKCFVLDSDLHVLYQVTPIYLSDQLRNLYWKGFLDIFSALSDDDKHVASLVGVEENFIFRAMIGAVSFETQKEKFMIHQRFYAALALNDLVNEKPINDVQNKYDLNKGVIQGLQQSASIFAGMVTAFCGKLGWSNLELLLSQFQERLQFGVQRELCELVRLSTMNGQRARIMYDNGIKTIAELAASDPAHIEFILHKAVPFQSTVHGGSDQAHRNICLLGNMEWLTESEAAQKIVEESRQFIQIELGLEKGVQFAKVNKPVESQTVESQSQLGRSTTTDLNSFKVDVGSESESSSQKLLDLQQQRLETASKNSSIIEVKKRKTEKLREYQESQSNRENISKLEDFSQRLSEVKDESEQLSQPLPLRDICQPVEIVEIIDTQSTTYDEMFDDSFPVYSEDIFADQVELEAAQQLPPPTTKIVDVEGSCWSNFEEHAQRFELDDEMLLTQNGQRIGDDFEEHAQHFVADDEMLLTQNGQRIGDDFEEEPMECDVPNQMQRFLEEVRETSVNLSEEAELKRKTSEPNYKSPTKSEWNDIESIKHSTPVFVTPFLSDFSKRHSSILVDSFLSESREKITPKQSISGNGTAELNLLNPELLAEFDKKFDSSASLMEVSFNISGRGGRVNFDEGIGNNNCQRILNSSSVIMEEQLVGIRSKPNVLLSESMNAAIQAVANDSKFDYESEDLFPDAEHEEVKPNVTIPVASTNIRTHNHHSVDLFEGTEESYDEFESSSYMGTSSGSVSKTLRAPELISKSTVAGKSLKVKKVYDTELIPQDMFEDASKPIALTIRIDSIKKAQSIGGIGSLVCAPKQGQTSADGQKEHSIVLFNGESTIWVFQWKSPEQNKPTPPPPTEIRNRRSVNPACTNSHGKLGELLDKLKSSGCPIIVLNSKETFKKLMKLCGNDLATKLPTGNKIWDPKIAHWMWQCEEDDDKVMQISSETLINVHLNKEQQKIKDFKWSKEITNSYVTFYVMHTLKNKLLERRIWDPFVEMEMPSTVPLMLMEMNGLGLDLMELRTTKNILEYKTALLEVRAYQLAGREFSLASPKEVHKVLFNELGLRRPRGTKGTPKDVLLKLEGDLPQIIIEWRKINTAIKNVVDPFHNKYGNLGTKRVRGNYSHFTVTGRVVMSEPSLQCIPRNFDLLMDFTPDDIEEITDNCQIKFGPKLQKLLGQIKMATTASQQSYYLGLSKISMRNVFIPSSSEFCLLAADYSQLELRILAHLSNDSQLLGALNQSGGDVFISIASTWKKLPPEQITSTIRQEAKGIVYGVIYGMGAKRLADQMEVDVQDAERFITEFMDSYPSIRIFLEETKTNCRNDGYIETICGRRRYLTNIKSKNPAKKAKAERQAVNSKIQGSAADLMKIAMWKIHSRLNEVFVGNCVPINWNEENSASSAMGSSSCKIPDSVVYFPVLNLHDELIFEVRKSHLTQVSEEIRQQMESSLNLRVQLPVVIKTGDSWGSLL